MIMLGTKDHTASVKIVGMVTYRAHALVLTCPPNAVSIDSSLHLDALYHGTIIFELSIFFHEIWRSSGAHSIKVVLPASCPVMCAAIVHQCTSVMTSSVVEGIFEQIVVCSSMTSDMARV